jgi:hypothetical protein
MYVFLVPDHISRLHLLSPQVAVCRLSTPLQQTSQHATHCSANVGYVITLDQRACTTLLLGFSVSFRDGELRWRRAGPCVHSVVALLWFGNAARGHAGADSPRRSMHFASPAASCLLPLA